MQEIRQTKIYDYDCKHNTASDPDGWLRMEVQPSVYFSVLKKGKDEPELDKGASKKNRDALASKAGMKHKDIVADVIKAIGPIVIEANMNPYRDKWRRKYSFDVFMQLLSVKFILRLSGAHSAGYAIVSIPRQYTLSTMKTRVCGPMHQVPLDGVVMGHINQHSEAANGALEEFDKKLEEVVEESNERMKKEAAKKGVKITPGEPKEEKKK
mmetsp:Transcript_18122/g.28087  ORF Transcript_18122/g.28087 Transcript_18122/m.28087 type:complete len:211 (+) Transcript_18122:3618-4250(+)